MSSHGNTADLKTVTNFVQTFARQVIQKHLECEFKVHPDFVVLACDCVRVRKQFPYHVILVRKRNISE
jgi:hypothetical protein